MFLRPIQEKQNRSFGEWNDPTRTIGTQDSREVPIKPPCGDHSQNWVSLFVPTSLGDSCRFPCHKILAGSGVKSDEPPNPKTKPVQLNLSTLLSVKFIPDLLTGKKLNRDFQYLYLTESLLTWTYDPITHPRWNMSKDSKLCLWEITERWNAYVDIISFPPLPNAYIQTGQRKHTLHAFSSLLRGPGDFISTLLSWNTVRALVHFQSLHLSRGTSKVFISNPSSRRDFRRQAPGLLSSSRNRISCWPGADHMRVYQRQTPCGGLAR